MSKEEEYPIGGFAPGNYWCNCHTCGEQYTGDKRSFQCRKCGEASVHFHEHLLKVLDFVATRFLIDHTPEELFSQYQQDIYNQFIANKNP